MFTSIKSIRTLLGAACLAATSLVYLGWQLFAPGDGSLIQFDRAPTVSTGLLVASLMPANSNLRSGDVLLAIEDRPIDEILRRLPSISGLTNRFEKRDVLQYRVWRDGQISEMTVQLERTPIGALLSRNWSSNFFLFYLELIGILVFLRRPQLAIARSFFLLSTAVFTTGLIFFLGLRTSDLLNPAIFWLWIWGSVIVYGLTMSGLLHFALVFPDRKWSFPTKVWHWALIYGEVWVLYFLAGVVGLVRIDGTTERFTYLMRSTVWMTLVYFSASMIVMMLRYRQSENPKELRQLRWLVWGAMAANIPWLGLEIFIAATGAPQNTGNQLIGLLWCAIPTTFAISILRERLFDIDALINRTLVYSLLSITLAVIYFGSVLILQSVYQLFTGQETQLAIVFSTLGIAALFNPLRSRVQSFIDSRFYRRKYDAEKLLAAFARTARDKVELDDLSAALLAVVHASVQPEHVGLWLRPIHENPSTSEVIYPGDAA